MPEVLVRKDVYAWMPLLPAISEIELGGTVVERGPGATEPTVGLVFVSTLDLPEAISVRRLKYSACHPPQAGL